MRTSLYKGVICSETRLKTTSLSDKTAAAPNVMSDTSTV